MRRWLYWVPVLIYLGIIFYFSSKSANQISLPTPDYIAHAVEYFGLSCLVWWAWLGSRAGNPGLAPLAAVIFCVLFGITDEFHQSFQAGRFYSWSDLLADFVGACLAQGLLKTAPSSLLKLLPGVSWYILRPGEKS